MTGTAGALGLGRPKPEGGPQKTSPVRENSPARETSKKTRSRASLSRTGENIPFSTQAQSARTNGTTFDEKITGVQNNRFHTWVDNATLGTLGGKR